MPMTPIGVAMRWMRKPFGRVQSASVRPSGSGSSGDIFQPLRHGFDARLQSASAGREMPRCRCRRRDRRRWRRVSRSTPTAATRPLHANRRCAPHPANAPAYARRRARRQRRVADVGWVLSRCAWTCPSATILPCQAEVFQGRLSLRVLYRPRADRPWVKPSCPFPRRHGRACPGHRASASVHRQERCKSTPGIPDQA